MSLLLRLQKGCRCKCPIFASRPSVLSAGLFGCLSWTPGEDLSGGCAFDRRRPSTRVLAPREVGDHYTLSLQFVQTPLRAAGQGEGLRSPPSREPGPTEDLRSLPGTAHRPRPDVTPCCSLSRELASLARANDDLRPVLARLDRRDGVRYTRHPSGNVHGPQSDAWCGPVALRGARDPADCRGAVQSRPLKGLPQ